MRYSIDRGVSLSLRDSVILIGAARSGTTFLADRVLARHPELAYWGEPYFLWRTGAAYRRTDRRYAHEASPKIQQRIRRNLSRFVSAAGDNLRLLEKTPSNTLRLSFVAAVLPGARFVHLVRDGRDVAASAAKAWTGDMGGVAPDPLGTKRPGLRKAAGVVASFARSTLGGGRIDVPAHELPYYAWRALLAWQRQLSRSKSTSIWGPRVADLARVAKESGVLAACAHQWCHCELAVEEDLQRIDRQLYLQMKFEDFSQDPVGCVQEILEFLELSPTSEVTRAASQMRSRPRGEAWLKLGENQRAAAYPYLQAALRLRGYEGE